MRLEICTLATLLPRFCFIQSHSNLYSFSNSFAFSSSSSPAYFAFLSIEMMPICQFSLSMGFLKEWNSFWTLTISNIKATMHVIYNSRSKLKITYTTTRAAKLCHSFILSMSLPSSKPSLLTSTNIFCLYVCRFVTATSSIGSNKNSTYQKKKGHHEVTSKHVKPKNIILWLLFQTCVKVLRKILTNSQGMDDVTNLTSHDRKCSTWKATIKPCK
jgi:hypothetical protein